MSRAIPKNDELAVITKQIFRSGTSWRRTTAPAAARASQAEFISKIAPSRKNRRNRLCSNCSPNPASCPKEIVRAADEANESRHQPHRAKPLPAKYFLFGNQQSAIGNYKMRFEHPQIFMVAGFCRRGGGIFLVASRQRQKIAGAVHSSAVAFGVDRRHFPRGRRSGLDVWCSPWHCWLSRWPGRSMDLICRRSSSVDWTSCGGGHFQEHAGDRHHAEPAGPRQARRAGIDAKGRHDRMGLVAFAGDAFWNVR